MLKNSALDHSGTPQNEGNPMIEWEDRDDSKITNQIQISVLFSAKSSKHSLRMKM